jgi:hypothetical protein
MRKNALNIDFEKVLADTDIEKLKNIVTACGADNTSRINQAALRMLQRKMSEEDYNNFIEDK